MKSLNNIIDQDGKIKHWPSKKEMKTAVISYLAEKFETNRFYSEKEVNSIIDNWHLFNDYFLLRRELIVSGLLSRTRNGARYWKTRNMNAPENDEIVKLP